MMCCPDCANTQRSHCKCTCAQCKRCNRCGAECHLGLAVAVTGFLISGKTKHVTYMFMIACSGMALVLA